jgi:phenylpropionate dioxygenase-like ring-hydroxylating dioxygenase large terminal subunit
MSAELQPRIPDALKDFPRSPPTPPVKVRGDRITGDRYYSREFMELEWDRMWKRVWHVGGRTAQLAEPGDYVVHNFRRESVVMIRQHDGSVRAFFNVCRHRGNRLFWNVDGAMSDTISCPYHGWRWAMDGSLRQVQDPEDFPQGNPCGKLTLREVPCATWGGLVWYSMDAGAKPLAEFLDPIPALLGNRDLESWVRVLWRTFDVNTNWKFASDNFNESYHLTTVHPQLQSVVDEDYKATLFEMFPTGHNRMIELGRPSLRAARPNEVDDVWAAMLREWDLDPAQFAGRARDGRLALQRQRRRLGPARGYRHFESLTDDELTDQFHHTLFPNVTITGTPEGLHFFRTEPHATDPERCTFDYWYMVPRIAGQEAAGTIYGERPIEEAQHETGSFAAQKAALPQGDFLAQDLSVAEMQQLGLHSMGYEDAYLSGQETRVRRFHEVLNDYLDGRR